jgi:ribonuclease HI
MSDPSTKLLIEIRTIFQSLIKDIDERVKHETIEEPVNTGSVITISCDGSILKNPGGRCAVGVVIQVPKTPPLEISQFTPSSTNNEAEFDAIYLGISNAAGLSLVEYPIVVESDSKIVVDSLNKKITLKEPRLMKKRDLILEAVDVLPSDLTFTWKRRNSTTGLRRANDLAQTLNGVKPH